MAEDFEAIAAQLRAQEAEKPAADPEVPAPDDDELEPEETEETGDEEAGDDDDADAPSARELALSQRERDLEERAKNMERGFQKKMQKASEIIKAAQEKAKANREVMFLADKMTENPAFAQDFMQLAQQYGVRLPDVTREDMRDEVDRIRDEILEKMEEEKFETRKASYLAVIESEESRLKNEYKIKQADVDAIFKIAQDPELPLLQPGMTPAQIKKALDIAAARYVLPRARSDGQRRLLSRSKDKAKSAAALAGSPVPTAPVRATSFNEDPETVLAKIRGTMQK
jgi:hypothetical protein